MLKLSVVLPVYATPTWLEICLDALNRSTIRNEIEVIAILNCNNNKIKIILDQANVDQILPMPTNLGVPAAFNEGATAAKSSRVCFLHTDTIVTPTTLENLLKHLDETQASHPYVIGALPVTNYANEFVLRVSNKASDDYIRVKPSNKSIPDRKEILSIFTEYYDNGYEGIEALDYYASRIAEENADIHVPLTQISHYCLVIEKSAFASLGMFDTDFYPTSFFEKLFYEKCYMKSGLEIHLCRDVYVHHNGNTTSDFFGFNYPEILERNEQKYKEKNREIEQAEMQQTLRIIESRSTKQLASINSLPVNPTMKRSEPEQALFIRQGGLEDILTTLPVIVEFKARFPNCKVSYAVNPEFVGLLSCVPAVDSAIEVYDKPTEDNWRHIIQNNTHLSTYFDACYDWTYYIESSNGIGDPVDVFGSKYGDFKPRFPELTVPASHKVAQSVGGTKEKIIVVASKSGRGKHMWDVHGLKSFSFAVKDSVPVEWKIFMTSTADMYGFSDPNVTVFMSTLELKDIIDLINRADVVIADDLGYYYIACILGKKVIGLFESDIQQLSDRYFTNNRETFPLERLYGNERTGGYSALAQKIKSFLS